MRLTAGEGTSEWTDDREGQGSEQVLAGWLAPSTSNKKHPPSPGKGHWLDKELR